MEKITIRDYLGPYAEHPDVTEGVLANALELLDQVNPLLTHLELMGADLDINPKTGTLISGTNNGGFRPRNCEEGAPNSSHKEGKGVDVYDGDGDLDGLLDDATLAKFGLYREHPSQTRGWLHLTNRAPKSKRRSFFA